MAESRENGMIGKKKKESAKKCARRGHVIKRDSSYLSGYTREERNSGITLVSRGEGFRPACSSKRGGNSVKGRPLREGLKRSGLMSILRAIE